MRREIYAVTIVVLLLLPLLPAPALAADVSHVGRPLHFGTEMPRASPPPQTQYTLPPNYYYDFRVITHGGGTQLKFSVSATATLDIYVMTSLQFSAFTTYASTSALYHRTASILSDVVGLPSKGQYYLLINNDISGATVSLGVSYSTVPVDIYYLHSSLPVPTGIADYGVENFSGSLIPYKQAISSVTATAVLNSVTAYNASSPAGASPYGASLQLNVMLRVNTTSGQRVYWLQNVLTLFTNNQTVYFADNIWNSTVPDGTLDPTLVSGSGSVYPYANRNYYVVGTDIFPYVAPLTAKFPISVSHSGTGVLVRFGYQEAPSGLPLSGPTIYFDNVTIAEHGAITDAAIVVSGYELQPSGTFFDAELVFGGECCGAITTFTSMDSTLSMSYTLTNGDVAVPKAVYEFGSDTAEGAFGIQTSLTQNKFHVSLGSVDFSASYATGPPLPVFLTFSYSVTDGSSPAGPPVLTYFGNGIKLSAPLGTSPTRFTVDRGTGWTVTSVIGGSTGERWATTTGANGTASTDQTAVVTFYHQYLLTAAYSLSGGGQPQPPSVHATAFGAPFDVTLGAQNATYWLDSGSGWSAPTLLGGSSSSHRWEATGGASGTVAAGSSIKPVYVEQYLVTVNYEVVGGGSAGGIELNATSFGFKTSVGIDQPGAAVWVDSGTTIAAGPLTTSSTNSERWVSNSTLSGFASAPLTVQLVYQHQYYLGVQSSAPSGTSVYPQSGWFDSGATVPIGSSVTALWRFAGWTGNGPGSYTGGAGNSSLVLSGPANETAVFDPGVRLEAGQGGAVSYLLGSTTGTVEPGSSAVVYAPVGTQLVLTAQPSILQSLTGWSGSVSSSEGSVTLVLRSPSQVVASFGLNYGEVGLLGGVGLVVVAVAALLLRRRGARS
ncbi:MAG: thermopsin [Nitrososphaerales archaeon]|nr:thermopsin [Nitrososphaerales archaeon]